MLPTKLVFLEGCYLLYVLNNVTCKILRGEVDQSQVCGGHLQYFFRGKLNCCWS